MAKETYYFSHDYEPTADPKMQALIGEFGAIGYGLYWRLVEMLHSDEAHKMAKKEYIYLAIAKQMSTPVERVKAVVEFCIKTCELFTEDATHFWSVRVLRNIEKREEIKVSRSKAGKKSAEKRAEKATSVEQVLTSVEQNPTKERKGKEKKGKEIKEDSVFTPPPLSEVVEYFLSKGYTEQSAKRAYEHYNVAGWKDVNGKKVANWKQKMNTVWFKHENLTTQNTKKAVW